MKKSTKKPTEMRIWSLLRFYKSLDSLVSRSTPEVAQYIRKVESRFGAEYQKWFDVCFFIFTEANKLNGSGREEYLKKYENCRDVVDNLLHPVEGVEYQDLIWKKLKPKNETKQ